MAVRIEQLNNWQAKSNYQLPNQERNNEQQNSHTFENPDFCSAFISHNKNGIWQIKLRQNVSTSLSGIEQIEQIKRNGFLAQCNEALATIYGHESVEQMMKFSGSDFPMDLFVNDKNLIEFVKADYQFNNIKTVRRDANGKVRYFNCEIFGILENKQLKQIWGTEREAETPTFDIHNINLYQPIIDSMVAHIAIIDHKGQIITTNQAWNNFASENELFGYDRNCIGTNYLDACSQNGIDKSSKEAYQGISDVLSGKIDYFSLEYPCHNPSGEERWFLLHATPLNNSSGAIVSHLNITKRKNAEQELKRAIEENEAANRLKDEFLSTVSHELRTPLTSMLGWTRLLRTGKLDEKTALHGLETIERNTQVQSRLIEDLLDVSRIINGKLRLEASPVKIRKIIESAIESVHPTASIKQLTINFVDEIEDASIYADQRRIQQVLWNLLTNAIKFTPRNGHIIVKMRSVDSKVEVSVTDNGIGINPDYVPCLFEKFRQVDGTSTRKHGGLGLGLAIVKHLIELHGGNVSAESAGEGNGATFRFTLPLLNLELESINELGNKVSFGVINTAERNVSKTQKLQGKKFLLVDDDRDNLELLSFLFEAAGVVIETASSAADALSKLSAQSFDLLISDIGMPEEDGYSLIKKVRNLPQERNGKIPAIALTAYAKNEDKLKAISSGFQRHIKKPVDPSDLTKQASELIEK